MKQCKTNNKLKRRKLRNIFKWFKNKFKYQQVDIEIEIVWKFER